MSAFYPAPGWWPWVNPTRFRRASLTMLLAILLLAAPLGLAQKPKGDAQQTNTKGEEQQTNAVPSHVDLDLIVHGPDRIQGFSVQNWEGDDARKMRQSLDAYFGSNDGTLAPSELDRIAEATEDDMANKTLSWIRNAEGSYVVETVKVSFSNATGTANRTHPLGITHELNLKGNATGAAQEWELRIQPLWNGTLTLRPPPGLYAIPRAGMTAEAADETEPGQLRGDFKAGVDVVVAISPTPLDQPGNLPPEESSDQPFWRGLPAPPLAAILATALLAALAAGRRKDR